MTYKRATLFLLVCVLLPVFTAAKPATYIGTKSCKMCHNKKTEVKQYDIWKASAHAKAYETLATDQAKEFAVKAGVEGDPQKAKECLECHVTGYGLEAEMFGTRFVAEEGVQCESCHGPGSNYKSTKVMSKKLYASQREDQHKLALEAGLTIPDEKTCVKCHNERSPAFKGFDFKTYYEKIKHEYQE